MNPFKKYPGIRINGDLYPAGSLVRHSMDGAHPPHLREVFAFSAKVFNRTESLTVATSGSTGTPKKMTFPKTAFETSAKATNAFFGLGESAQALLALPMRYIAGKMMVVRAIAGGYNLDVVVPTAAPSLRPSGPQAGARPYDFVPLTPHQAGEVLSQNAAALRSVGAVLIGGGPVSNQLQAELSRAGVRAFASFGMTETLSHFAIAGLGEAGSEVEYALLPGAEVKVKKNGLLRVKWPGITEGWLDTNDLVSRTPQGFQWMGRHDHLINSGGVKVVPELVEKRIAHLIDAPFFVAGIPHPKLGEEVALIVEAEGKVEHTLLSEVQHALTDTPFWQPRKMLTVPAFAYTESGKVKRRETLKGLE